MGKYMEIWANIGKYKKVESESVALLPPPDPISGSKPPPSSCPALPKCFVLRLPIYIVRSDYLFSPKPLYFGLTLPLHTDSTKKLPARLSRLESIIFVQHNRTEQQLGRTNR